MRNSTTEWSRAAFLAASSLLAAGLQAHNEAVRIYSAASMASGQPVAPNSIAIVEGQFGDATVSAPSGDPQVELGGFRVAVEGPDGVERAAAIFLVEPNRMRILMPSLPDGTAHITASRDAASLLDGTFAVRSVSPGLFSAADSGGGLADATVIRANLARGTRHVENVAYFNARTGSYEAVLLNPAAEGTVLFLKLRGTGIRNATSVSATIAGVPVPAHCDPASGGGPGEDEVSVGPLPVQLAHREIADIVLTADGVRSNAVQIAFSPSAGPAITFSNQISRLFQERCQECHREGEVAPFPLVEYADAKAWSASIKRAVQLRTMPPWKPVPGHGKFLDERRLSDDEIEMVRLWVDAGAPEGNPADLPAPPVFDADWILGEPDLILEAAEFTPDPNGEDEHRCFSVPLPDSIEESKSIIGLEFQPSNRKIVHHVLLFADPLGESSALQAAASDGRPGYDCYGGPGITLTGLTVGVESYLLGGWAPGTRPQALPEGTGIYLRRGSHVTLQVHYYPDGTEQSDSTRIGLHFAEARTPKNASVLAAANMQFLIPPGDSNYEVKAAFSLHEGVGDLPASVFAPFLQSAGLFPADIINVFPHMHDLGRQIRMEKVSPSGERTPMIYIDDWDFNWQGFYEYAEPVKFDINDRMEVTAYYDNSASNPRNPNRPPIPVGWGEKTSDEMCIVFFTVVIPDLCRLPFGYCRDH